ncbi:PREDICTED: pentatricopeptide repeat-containing protein At4g18520 [Tarenaya hassleriana]|uniref:pentatricopeptide repeat-containing protein At4g18520 n=1 Tax=Tarenaya hassleriana TaxID=28532 RepID=UPI00053C9DAC|nr:PREDICTED: pentatricopeptide repeat-containing protein At4g18520 [Tarenaya hassleriana]
MFSLTFSSPHLPLSHPNLPAKKPFRYPTTKSNSSSKLKQNNHRNESPSGSPCISCKIYSFESESDSLSSSQNTGEISENGSPCSSPSSSERVNYAILAGWLQSSNGLRLVKRIHAMALKCLDIQVIYFGNNLISSYVRVGDLTSARKVFDILPHRNTVTWTAMIDGYLKFGLENEAFSLFATFVKRGIRFTNERMFVCLLNLCSRRSEFELGRQLHAHLVKGQVENLIVDSALVYFYAQCGELASALRAFDLMKEKDVISWTAVISACSRKGHGKEAIFMFSQLLNQGFLPNEFTVCSILKACSELKAIRFGRQLHSVVVKKVIKNDVFVGTSLMDMYAKCGKISDCRKVFDAMSNRNTVTWTSIIAAHAREELGDEAISLFRVMKRRNLIANNLTVVSILRACGSIGALLLGKELHAQIIKNSIEKNVYIGSTLVWLYCKCGEYNNAFNVLHHMPSRDVVSWTAMISGCLSLGHESEALAFLKEMIQEGVEPNPFTYSSALKACANSEALRLGKSIHSIAKKNPALSNVFVGSALIHMYAKCGFVTEAFRVFDSMPEKNLVSWKAMVMGYARNGFCQEALKLMYRMQAEGFKVDDYIFTTIISTCGDIEHETEPSAERYLESSASL